MSLHLFRSMVGVGLSLDAVTYSAVLNAVFDHQDAWEVFSEDVGRGLFPRLLAAESGEIDLHDVSPVAALMVGCLHHQRGRVRVPGDPQLACARAAQIGFPYHYRKRVWILSSSEAANWLADKN
eukprot:UN4932